MNKLVVSVIVVVILIAGGIFLLTKNNAMNMQNMPAQSTGEEQTNQNNAQPENAAKNAVTIQNYAFSPATITVKAGDSVTWTNQDSTGHSATADDGSFDTGVLANGQSKSVTFSNPGTYTYHCSVHPYMKGTVIVQ